MFITFVKVSHNIFEPFHFFSYDMLIFIITFPIAEGNEKKNTLLEKLGFLSFKFTAAFHLQIFSTSVAPPAGRALV